jgi:hypothetical protein
MKDKYETNVAVVEETTNANRDPITGEPGSHPIGTGAGSVAGAAGGAAIGAVVGGPIGAVLGGVVGAVAGGAAGHSAGEAVNPTLETTYWREHYTHRPYYVAGKSFDYYEPAYRYGWETAGRPEYKNKKFDEIEATAGSGWDNAKGKTELKWVSAKPASRDAFNRVCGYEIR